MKTVSNLVAEKQFLDKYTSLLEDMKLEGVKKGLYAGVTVGFSRFTIFGSMAVTFYAGT